MKPPISNMVILAGALIGCAIGYLIVTYATGELKLPKSTA